MPTMSYAAPQMSYAAPQMSYAAPQVDRQVYTEQVTVPQQVTSMVPQTTYQARTIQVPQVQQVRVPRTTYETQTQNYQVPQMTYETQTIQVPKQIMVPQMTYETQTIQVPRPVYETKYRTVQVPRTVYDEQQVPYQEQVYETRSQTIQVPRMTEEIQNVTNMVQQTVQEPVQTMIPQTHTVNTIQQINKVVEYARTPVNQYTVPGPTYTQPVQQMSYAPQMSYSMPSMSMPAYGGYSMPAYGGYSGYSTTGASYVKSDN
jgi:hypothetical protein